MGHEKPHYWALSNPHKPATGGAEGDRTPDLRAASAALSRLSYGPKDLQSIASKGMVSMRSERRGFLPVLLGGTAPEGLQTIVVARLVGKDMDDHVDEVQADPGAPLIYAP